MKTYLRQTSSLAAVTRPAQQLKIFDLTGTTHGYRNNVVKLQLRSSATHSASTLIAYPDELFDVVRYVPALADARLFTHGNHGSRPIDALPFPLVPGEQQRMDIVAVHVVVVPVEPVLEPLKLTAIYDRHEDRFTSLLLLFFEVLLLGDHGAREFLASDAEPPPAHGDRNDFLTSQAEQPRQARGLHVPYGLESDGHIVGTAQHGDSGAWRNKRTAYRSSVLGPEQDIQRSKRVQEHEERLRLGPAVKVLAQFVKRVVVSEDCTVSVPPFTPSR